MSASLLILEFQVRGRHDLAEFGDVAIDDVPKLIGRRAPRIDRERAQL